MTETEKAVKERKTVVGDLPSDEVFVATLTLRSVGANPAIIPEVSWSHGFDDDLDERASRGQLPVSFIAMSQIVGAIARQMAERGDMVDPSTLPEDGDEAARVIAALAEKHATNPTVN